MEFFWGLIIMTVMAVSLNSIYGIGLELIILLVITDCIVLWTYMELDKKHNEKSVLTEKVENLERLISGVFDKVNKRYANNKNDKKELVKWLNKF